MSHIDDIRAALMQASEKAEQISAAVQHGATELHALDGLMIHAAANSNNQTYAEASLAFMHSRDQLEQAQGLLRTAMDHLANYIQQL